MSKTKEEVVVSEIAPLTNRFQTEDMNVIVDKINEIITKING